MGLVRFRCRKLRKVVCRASSLSDIGFIPSVGVAFVGECVCARAPSSNGALCSFC